MNSKPTSGPRYEALKRVMEGERLERRKAQRSRVFLECLLGTWLVVPALLWAGGEGEVGGPEFFRAPTPYESHLLSLGRSGLLEAPAGRQWIDAGYLAIDHPLVLGPGHLEEGFFPTASSQALGFRMLIPEGQRATVTVEGTGNAPLPLYLDLFRAAPDTFRRPVPVESGELRGGSWTFDSPEAHDYILRLQPQMKEGGRYRLTIRVGARFLFPVEGAGEQDVGSVFGDPRDGGQREHHGVDIFHPRGTPVLAAAAGTISSVNETGLGGRVVWQREDGGSHSLYYAHLDRQLVRRGQRVSEGDTIGLVGNTGNARTTPPHLHFGIYRRGRGPVDPWNLIFPISPHPPEVTADPTRVEGWARTTQAGVLLRRSPSERGEALSELPRHAAVRILAAVGGWYRVGFPGGPVGYLPARTLLFP